MAAAAAAAAAVVAWMALAVHGATVTGFGQFPVIAYSPVSREYRQLVRSKLRKKQ